MKSGYDQFFKQAKKNTEKNYQSVPLSKSNHIAELVKQRRSDKKNNSKRRFPIMSFFTFGICVVAMFFLIEKFDSIEVFLSKIEIGLGSESAIAAPDTNTASKDEKSEKVAQSENGKTDDSVKLETKPVDDADYLFKLSERKKQLDAREEDLNKQAAEIQKQKTEIEEKLKLLESSREKISGLLKDRITGDSQKVDTLVQVYTNMKPNQAAKIFESMDEDLVIDILSRMKKKNAADILNLVKSDKAQALSEKFAGYRSLASQNPAELKNAVGKPADENEINSETTNESTKDLEKKAKP
jgi:flagellar motility protein MotE (MotC chaperone)